MVKKHSIPPSKGQVNYTLDPSRMKDSGGRYLTQALFLEHRTEGYDPVFTLKDYDREGLPSFKRLYVALGDPTEYLTALSLLGSWDHWTKLTECSWLQEALSEAREELSIKFRSEAIARIKQDAEKAFSEATRLAANKFLATEGYTSSEDIKAAKSAALLKATESKRGRPSKEEVEKRMVEELRQNGTIDNDFERILGNPVQTKQ